MIMENKIFITREQLSDLRHFERMFMHHRDELAKLCSEEDDDIVYGFELGKMHNYLSDHHLNMMNLLDKIDEQSI